MSLTRIIRLSVAVLCVVALAACGEGTGLSGNSDSSGGSDQSESSDTGSTGERIDINGNEALLWGDGDYGVLLAHGAAFDAESWEEQAQAIADQGQTAIAVESLEPDAIIDAVTYLSEQGIDDVALVGGSAGADAILTTLTERGALNPDQMILLAPNSIPEKPLDAFPKLFIAAEGDPVADVSTELAKTATGNQNEALIVDGDAHAQNLFDSDAADEVTTALLDRLKK